MCVVHDTLSWNAIATVDVEEQSCTAKSGSVYEFGGSEPNLAALGHRVSSEGRLRARCALVRWAGQLRSRMDPEQESRTLRRALDRLIATGPGLLDLSLAGR